LRVAASDNDGVGALGGSKVEETLGLAVGSACGAFGESVGANTSGVWAANALAGDVVGAVGGLQAFASRRANGGALLSSVSFRERAYIGTIGGLTMLPTSVEPRAKMNVMGRQLPLVSSLTVEPTRVPNCLRSTAAGRAAAVPARKAMAAVNFMFAVVLLLLGYLLK
jgi:hypothetical protein